MTLAEKTAFAMLHCGASFDSAAKAANLSVEHVFKLWAEKV
jgi:hypothetical protein